MKRAILAVLISLCFQHFVFAQYKAIQEEKLTVADGRYFYKNRPLNGKYHLKFKKPNAHFSEKVNFVDGLKSDTMATVFRQSKKEEKGPYVAGLKEGIWKSYMYNSGNLLRISLYKHNLKEGMGLDFLFGKDTLYYKSGKLEGWQSLNQKYTKTKKYYEHGVLKQSIETDSVLSFKKSCAYAMESFECNSERRYDSIVRAEKITGDYHNRLQLNTAINKTITHRVHVEKIVSKDTIRFIADFYVNNQQYEKWEVVISSSLSFDLDQTTKIMLNPSIYEIVFHREDNKLSTAYRLSCRFYESLMNLNHKVDFFIYDYNQRGSDYTKNYRKYILQKVESSGDMLGGCVPEFVENSE